MAAMNELRKLIREEGNYGVSDRELDLLLDNMEEYVVPQRPT